MKILWPIIIFAVVVISVTIYTSITTAQSIPPSPLAHLVRLSDREFIDPSQISYVILPGYTVKNCPDCEDRYGANMIIGGQVRTYTVETEAQLRAWLGNPPVVHLNSVPRTGQLGKGNEER